VRSRSPRHAAEDAAYKALRHELLPGPCEVCPALQAQGVQVQCEGTAHELHHLRKRSSSGALAERTNVRRSCWTGNQAVERWPTEARAARLVVREGDPEWDSLSSRLWRLNNL
jgi:hypothetical protein